MPGLYSPHGTTVTFDGTPIGYLTGYDWEAKAGDLHEVTHVASAVVGSGQGARVVKEYDVTSIEPPTLTITFFGPPSFSMSDAGLKAQIEFDGNGSALQGEAILMTFSHEGRAGQWTTGSATFQLTGV